MKGNLMKGKMKGHFRKGKKGTVHELEFILPLYYLHNHQPSVSLSVSVYLYLIIDTIVLFT